MGDWHISVQGTGIHHNGVVADADQRFARFVEQLRADGHTIVSATFTHGGRTLPEQVGPLKTEAASA